MEEDKNTQEQATQSAPEQKEPKKSVNLWLIVGLVVLLAAVAFWMLSGGTPAVDTEDTQEQTEEMNEEAPMETLEVQLNEQNESGQSGTALLEDLGDGTTRVTINATSSIVGPQPAHIHSGTCEDLGGVEYPLENVVEGESQTVVEASLSSLQGGTFAINLHMSPQEIGVFTSCGNI
ncbi:MAG: hypothetical protein R3251_04130 [Candidatus Spechtbacterales bacterium]|nr:hypothetical protein [Candidatus Spechtbacterales bacterium]